MTQINVFAPNQSIVSKKKRVAAYCRVSTGNEDQRNSFEAQKIYFTRLYRNSPEYELVDIYADLGISGTRNDRPEFMRLLDDCRKGKVDAVVTKSISRFARNTRDCLMALRELKRLGVTVAFEKENIDTSRVSDEIMITIMEGLAQEESISISKNTRWSIRKRMANGTMKIARVPYGYTKDKKGNLVIDKPKAEIVKRIYDLYLNGCGGRRIALLLNEEHIPSPTGTVWNNATIFKILKQEKYIGDILWQKTYSVFMGEKWKINRGDVDSWYIKDAHPAIIDRETFIKAQELRQESTYTGKRGKITTPFKGMIRCTCGRSFCFVNNKYPYWECSARFDFVKPCSCNIVYNDAIETVWTKMCYKLRHHTDEILSPILIQLERMDEAVRGGEMKELEERADDIRQRRYVLHKLCSEGVIDYETLIRSSGELEAELKEITDRADRLNENYDDMSGDIELICNAVTTVPPERLAGIILDCATVDNDTITFRLKGGLEFKERI